MNRINTLSLGFSNAFIIRDNGIIMIDTGTNVNKEKYIKLFLQLGIDPKDINLIVISHGHSDHFAQLYELKCLTRAPVLCHRNAIEALQTGKYAQLVARNELGERMAKSIKINYVPDHRHIKPDIIIDSTFNLSPYGINGRIVPTPGHSDCSISVILDTGEAFVGDILINSLFSGELQAAYFANDEKALFSSIHMLVNEADTFYAGHGGPYTRQEVIKLLEN